MTDMAGDPKILGVPTVVDTKGYKLLLNQRVGKLRFIKPGVNADYLKLALQSKRVREYLKRFAGGGVQLNVSKKDILNAPVRMRTEEEQDYIAGLFRRILEIKKQREQELLCLDNLIKARFVELLNPFFDQDKTEPLMNFVDEKRPITYGILKPGTNVEGGYPVIRVKDFSKGLVSVDDVLHTSQEIYSKYLRSTLDEGDIIISIGGTIGRVAIVPYEFVGANITQHTARVALKDKSFLLYYRGLFESDIMQRWMKGRVLGIAQPSMNLGDVKKMPIPMVEEAVKRELNSFVEQVDKSKVEVKKALDETQALFDSLMQEYFG